MALVLSTGCFYVQPINQRPAIEIQQTSSAEVYRGSPVDLKGVAVDPEGQLVFFQWRAYACIDGTDLATCDAAPFYTEILEKAHFKVPVTRADSGEPVQSVLVILEAKDDYGAIARPRQQLVIPVGNHPPELTLSRRSRYMDVVNTPMDLFAEVSDPDDGAASTLPLTWKVFSPSNQPAYDLLEVDVPDPNAPTSLQLGQRLTPHGTGMWEVQVSATDPLGATTTKSLMFEVKDDRAPCLTQYAPIAASAGNVWPLTEATLFQVSVISDDLDPFPTIPGDALLGTSTFSWTIKQPGATTRTALPGTGNSVALDPGNYAPGDIVELRVEIADRKATPINCADDQDTCSVISDNTCIQRLTWRVEVH